MTSRTIWQALRQPEVVATLIAVLIGTVLCNVAGYAYTTRRQGVAAISNARIQLESAKALVGEAEQIAKLDRSDKADIECASAARGAINCVANLSTALHAISEGRLIDNRKRRLLEEQCQRLAQLGTAMNWERNTMGVLSPGELAGEVRKCLEAIANELPTN